MYSGWSDIRYIVPQRRNVKKRRTGGRKQSMTHALSDYLGALDADLHIFCACCSLCFNNSLQSGDAG
jgi:hypothetical protein